MANCPLWRPPARFDPRPWRLDTEEARGLATLDTAPEFPLGRNNKVLVERIGMGGDLDPFAAAGNNERTADPVSAIRLPSKRTMSTAALESQVDALYLGHRWTKRPGDRLRESFPWMRIHGPHSCALNA